MINDVMTEEMLLTNPLSLLAIKDEQVINRLNNLVPYSTGFEIECDKSVGFILEDFKSIPDIMAVDVDNYEQRYRIPNGLTGIICLYNICYQLRIHSLLNPLSSIHYHVDCTDCYSKICDLIRNEENTDWILSELDTWLTNGCTASGRGYGSWFRCNNLQTVEFRLGEMTFDYRLMLKRIIHCNSMVKKLKKKIGGLYSPVFKTPDRIALEEYSKLAITKNRVGSNLMVSLDKIEKNLQQLDSKKVQEEKIVVRKRINKIGDE